MEIKKVNIGEVENWEKNPRGCKKEDFIRLKKQIQKLGIYKHLLVYYDEEKKKYITLGGNMRLRALKELKYMEVDVSIVNPKSEVEKLEYSLSDNDRAGYYIEQELAELIHEFKDSINLNDFKTDLGKLTAIGDILNPVMPDDKQIDPVGLIGDNMRVVINIPNDMFEQVEPKIKAVCNEYKLEIDIS